MTDRVGSPEHRRFVEALLRLAAAFGEQTSELTFVVYWEALEDMNVDYLATAATRITRDGRFFPKPIEWRQEAREVEMEERHRRPRLSEESVVLDDAQHAEVLRLIDDLKQRLGWGGT